MSFITGILGKIAKGLLASLVTEKMFKWALEKFASKTDNLIDDNVVKVIVGALESNADEIQEGVDGVVDETLKLFNKDDKSE